MSYFDGFDDEEDVEYQFSIRRKHPWDRILAAIYSPMDYEGWAVVIFERNGQLFSVEGSHCSCFGLEGQWAPVEISREALKYTADNGGGIQGTAASEALKILDS